MRIRKACRYMVCMLSFMSFVGCAGVHPIVPQRNHQNGTVTISFVGDIMMQEWQLRRGYQKETGTFDFTESFSYVKPYLEESDLTIGNLELTMAGANHGRKDTFLGYGGYPYFNAPSELAWNLKEAGFDLVTTGNNHCLDSGGLGLEQTLHSLDQAGLQHTGTFLSREDWEKPCILEVKGLRIGLVSYTYGVNCQEKELPEYAIHDLRQYGEQEIQELMDKIDQLQAEEVDTICAVMHFGEEYQSEPNEMQRTLAHQMIEKGVDVIIGSHPHVVQPMEIYEVEDADGTKRTGYICYSLGDFLAGNGKRENDIDTDCGMIADVHFAVYANESEKDRLSITVTMHPTYLYWTKDVIGVVVLEDAFAHPEQYPFLSKKDWTRMKELDHKYR